MNTHSDTLQIIALEVGRLADEGVLRPTGKHIVEKVGVTITLARQCITFLNKHSRPSSVRTLQAENLQKVALVISEATDSGIKPTYNYVARQLGLGRSTVASSISFFKKHSRLRSSTVA